MNKSFLLAIAAALLAAPLAIAHNLDGTPKNYCENVSEWDVHDYGPPATGFLSFLSQDGNLAGDCNGDTIRADYDHHSEFALGGAWLMVDSGDGWSGGSLACYGEVGHHPTFGPFTVTDFVLGPTVPFTVASDTVNNMPNPEVPNCGDFELDCYRQLIHTGTPNCIAGLDGAYVVFVGDVFTGSVGTMGHVFSP